MFHCRRLRFSRRLTGALLSGVIFLPMALVFRANSYQFTETEKQEMLEGHNHWRAKIAQKAKVDIPALAWSDDLANLAQDWANQLAAKGFKLEHRKPNRFGENLAWGFNTNYTPTEVLETWAGEEKYYDYETNSCSRVCGHYTQVIWRHTAKVGCGRVKGEGGQEIWVCNYDPPGNIVGEKPY